MCLRLASHLLTSKHVRNKVLIRFVQLCAHLDIGIGTVLLSMDCCEHLITTVCDDLDVSMPRKNQQPNDGSKEL